MNLSRRGFFKGLLGIAAGVAAAQVPSCGTTTPAYATEPKPTDGMWVVKQRFTNGWPQAGRIHRYKGEILAHAVPSEMLTATKIRKMNAVMDGKLTKECLDKELHYIAKRFLPYSADPLAEGTTPTFDHLLVRDPRVD